MANPADIQIENLVSLMLNFHRTFSKELLKKYQETRRLKQIFPTVTGISDEVVFTEMQVGEVAQAYQSKYTPKGDLKLIPEAYKLRYLKVDKDIDPNSLRQTYMAEYISSAQTEEHEIVRRFYADIMERSAIDTDDALINGVYVAPTDGTASSSGSTVDGLKEVIKKFATKKQITPFTAVAIDEANACSAIYDFWKQVPAKYRDSPNLKCYIYDNTWTKYKESYDATYGMFTDFDPSKRRTIRNTNCEIVVLPFGGESDMVLFTMDKNICLLEKKASDAMRFKVETSKRMISYMQDWATGIAIKVVGEANNAKNQYVWCNNFDYIKE